MMSAESWCSWNIARQCAAGLLRNARLEHLHHLEAIRAAALVVGVEARVVDVEADERREARPPAVGVGHGERHPEAVLRSGRWCRSSGCRRRGARSAAGSARRRSRETPAGRGSRRTCCRRGATCRPPALRRSSRGGAARVMMPNASITARVHLAVPRVDRRLAGLRQDRHHAGARRGELVDRRQSRRRDPWGRSRSRGRRSWIRSHPDVGRSRSRFPQPIRGLVGNHDVGGGNQLGDDRATRFARRVDRQALLVSLGEVEAKVPSAGRMRSSTSTSRRAAGSSVSTLITLAPKSPSNARSDRSEERFGDIEHENVVERAAAHPRSPRRFKSPTRCWHHGASPPP